MRTMAIAQLIDNSILIGSIPDCLIGTPEGAAICAEIDKSAAEIRESWNQWPKKPRRGKIQLPRVRIAA